MNDLLTLTGGCDLEAAAADKPAKVSILAYTGATLNAPTTSSSPVVIDVRGLKFGESVTLLSDHDSTRRGVVGAGTATVRGSEVHVVGTISRASEAGREIISLAADGVRWQASVGVEITNREQVRPGETVTVNGRAMKAGQSGLTVVRGGVLRETSITALGLDGATAVTIAARKKDRVMSWFKRPVAEPAELDEGGEVATLTDAEDVRTTRINAMFAGGDWSGVEREAESLRMSAIVDGSDLSEVQTRIGKLRDLRDVKASRPRAPSGPGAGAAEPTPNLLTASLMLRCGHEQAALKAFGERTVQQAHDLRVRNLIDLAGAALRLDGRDIPHSRDEMLRAAFSSVHLPTILSNTIGRSLLPAYEELTSEIFRFVTVKSAANFKPQTDIRPSGIQSLEQVGPGGEITHGHPNEEDTFTWSVSTFARMLTITRNDIINDDLGYFDTLPGALATSAARKLLDVLWTLILGGQTAGHFASGNGNLLEAGSALAIGTLASAVKTFRDQRDNAGNNIGIAPQVLCVPTALETTARVLLSSAEVISGTATTTQPNGNPVGGIVPQLLVEPRMSNSDKFSGTSSTAYYLFGGPASHALIVGFLNGNRTPTVETEAAPFNTLGVSLRCVHDFGVAFGDPRAALKATGAS